MRGGGTVCALPSALPVIYVNLFEDLSGMQNKKENVLARAHTSTKLKSLRFVSQ